MAYPVPTEYPTQEYLLSMLDYNPETGDLRWRSTRGRRTAGAIAGYFNPVLRRIRVRLLGRLWYSYDIIWCMQTGHFPRWPEEEIDHKDVYGEAFGYGDRWENLRLTPVAKNRQNKSIQKNNTTGYPGLVAMDDGRFRAVIKADRKTYHLGTFPNFEAAKAARVAAEHRLFGEYKAAHVPSLLY